MNKLQKRWAKEEPEVYDKENRLVRMYIGKALGGEDNTEDGYSYCEVQIDKVMDYAHIKSQLIEAAYTKKDEFGVLANAVDDMLTAISSASSFANLKSQMDTADIEEFKAFCTYRDVCAAAAKKVLEYY